MARLGVGTEAQRIRWLQAMTALFPDVSAGQRLAGVNLPGRGAEFHLDGRLLGRIDDPAFGPAFFAIWLDCAHQRAGPAHQPAEAGVVT